ncbi:MAG: phosphoribosylformylglycinamidine synthase subunit PurL [Roseiflexaceae bacterium]|nr:phosphoribosylformylglycinamidine synthase subunit PurL [Roseiflexaceae bacterium]
MGQFLVSVRSRVHHTAPQLLYVLDAPFDQAAAERLAMLLLHDPLVQSATTEPLDRLADLDLPAETRAVEIAYLPGVTDNQAESVKIGALRLSLPPLQVVHTLRRHLIAATSNPAAQRALYNPLIESHLVLEAGPAQAAQREHFYRGLLQTPGETSPQIARVALREADDARLQQISRAGILALDLAEMRAIQAFYRSENREPTDGELETLAQTWSEHCSHKTFKARVRYVHKGQGSAPRDQPELYAALHLLESAPVVEIDSLIKTFLISATAEVLKRRTTNSGQPATDGPAPKLHPLTPDPWILSAFVDNAGIIAFGEAHELSIKVETHNHPSALEPFGGANTGVGGVVRDVLGVSAQPIANTNVLCFGPLDLALSELAPGVLHPRTVAAGVVAGVRDYGNKLGIPMVNGAVLYERGYTANPLVFCGTVGLAPRGRHPRNLQPGDACVVLGGRTGRDGIHGATFSSEELTNTTAQEVGSAVQIGDPISEKKLLDVLMQARDAGLYSAITDCGAGGLSSAVGEMGEKTGVRVTLEAVPLKYAGLQPWEIWLSEAQERMVLAVPPVHLPELLGLCAGEDVEATVIGEFSGDGRLTVTHQGALVVDLAMAFLHDGRPQRVLEAEWRPAAGVHADRTQITPDKPDASYKRHLLALLAHPNIASKAAIIRTYDHEVGGRTVIKPLVGVERSGPGDAAVLRPLPSSSEGLALGCGINPRYGAIDPYWMALAVVDEALRNVVAVGGDPGRTVILDNFCWGDPRLPDRMAGLTRAAAGCYDAALAYGTPFVSGKDSLNNEYRDAAGNRQAIPPTLLITALAHVPDVQQAVTMDLKEVGNQVYLVGITDDELAGGHLHDVVAPSALSPQPSALPDVVAPPALSPQPSALPTVDIAMAPRILAAVHAAIRSGLVRACHDLSEGGLAVAAAEMAFAGGHGLALDLAAQPTNQALSSTALLFAESPTRFLVEVPPQHAAAFESLLLGLPHAVLGVVASSAELVIHHGQTELIRAPLGELQAAWQGTTVV